MLFESVEGYVKRRGDEEMRREVAEYRFEMASRLTGRAVRSQMVLDEAQETPGRRESQGPALSKILKTERKHSDYPIHDAWGSSEH
jgi:hypothetical protein